MKLLNCGAGDNSWESLECKEIKSGNPEGNQPWIFIGRANAEAPILWPPGAKNWLIGKDHDAQKDWRQKGKMVAEDEMVGWYHQHRRYELEQTLGDSGGLACCNPWNHRVGQDLATGQQQSHRTVKFRFWNVLPKLLKHPKVNYHLQMKVNFFLPNLLC